MCDLTQFFISLIVFNITAVVLAKVFIYELVLTFSMVYIFVIENIRMFKGVFIGI